MGELLSKELSNLAELQNWGKSDDIYIHRLQERIRWLNFSKLRRQMVQNSIILQRLSPDLRDVDASGVEAFE